MLNRNNIILYFPVFVLLTLGCCLLIGTASRAAEASGEMTVAIASFGKDGSSLVGPTATRSPYYLIFTASGRLREVIENPYRHTRKGSGACIEAMKMLSERQVTHVVAESFGSRTAEIIRSTGMHQVRGSGEVQSVLDTLLASRKTR